MPCGLLLVKNLYKDKVAYYWVSEKGKRVSPIFSQKIDAEAWWKTYMFSQYTGVERRRTVKDRRHCHSTREVVKSRKGQNAVSPGRRVTDQPIDVDIDLYKKKLKDEISGFKVDPDVNVE